MSPCVAIDVWQSPSASCRPLTFISQRSRTRQHDSSLIGPHPNPPHPTDTTGGGRGTAWTPPPFYARPLLWPAEAEHAVASYRAPDLEALLRQPPIRPFEVGG